MFVTSAKERILNSLKMDNKLTGYSVTLVKSGFTKFALELQLEVVLMTYSGSPSFVFLSIPCETELRNTMRLQ